MAAGKRDIYIEAGASFEMDVTWMVGSATPMPKDLTGAQAWLQIRARFGAPLMLELSSDDNEIFFPGAGIIRVEMDYDQTASLTSVASPVKRAKYDLLVQLPDPGATPVFYKVRLLEGKVTISPPITVEGMP